MAKQPLMRFLSIAAVTLPVVLCIAPVPALAQSEMALPEPVRKMLESAIASKNDAEIATIAKYARETAPEAQAEIDAMVQKHKEVEAAAIEEKRSNPNIFALWKGKVELGGFRSTGSSSEVGVAASATAKRRGLKWTHVLHAAVDYRRANGQTSKDRILASYTPRYDLSARSFIYGLAQYERDPSLGFESRYTGSAGIGYRLIDTDTMSLTLDAGPSLRRVHYAQDGTKTKWGARSSADFEWAISPTLTFRQTGSAYAEQDILTLSSLTALDTKLISVLTARLSYDVLYEKDDRLLDTSKLDTLSKVSLIYEF